MNKEEIDFEEVLNKYISQERLDRTEGPQGVRNLCALVNTLGYKDTLYFGQLSNGCCIGDLTNFLEDNPGAIEAMFTWIGEQNVPEWKEKLESELMEEDAEESDAI